jgi:hypothetical protein
MSVGQHMTGKGVVSEGEAIHGTGHTAGLQEAELLGTAGCHLCDEAEAVLRMAAGSAPLLWRHVEITDSDELLVRYGERIPVLRHRNGELCWPFGVLDVVRLVRGQGD